MIVWDVLDNDGSVRSIGVGYVRGETIILLAQKVRLNLGNLILYILMQDLNSTFGICYKYLES